MSAKRIPIVQGHVQYPVEITHRLGNIKVSPINRIERTVSRVFGVGIAELHGPSRRVDIADARQALYRLLHGAGWSLNEIGRYLGNRNHGTVHWGIRSSQDKETDPRYREKLNAARAALGI